MEKKTAKEILDILEESGLSVDNFAYGDYPDDFKYSEGLEESIKKYDKARENYISHPGYRDKNLRDAEFERLNNVYMNTSSPYTLKMDEFTNSLGLGKIVEVEHYGGEDQGSTWFSVKHFVDHDVYIRTDGYYSSYNGTEFYEGFGKEVFPAEKVVKYFSTEKPN